MINRISKKIIMLILIFCMILTLSSCSFSKNKEPITLTMWQVYGAQTDSPMNDMIDEFNETVGREKGIKIQVKLVSTTNDIHDAVLAAANHEPGASELPDIFSSYPKTIMAMPDQSILVDYKDYFSDSELQEFVPEFIDEGIIDDRLLVLPVAKSTEILFINKTIFDRFAADTGVSLDELSTWEGLYSVSEKYYKWTDDQTPSIPNDGKAFLANDYHFNYYQVGVTALGEQFFDGDGIKDSETLKNIFGLYANAAIKGGIWLDDGYATAAIRTGDIIASIASSASVLYFEDIVTYEDNTSEPIEVISMPVPVFEQGEKLVMQRGTGLCTVKSTPEREKAAMEFLRWITEPENNVKFVTQVGYMPVKTKSFDYLEDAIDSLESNKYKSLYRAFIKTQEEYEFYVAPKLESYLSLEKNIENISRSRLNVAREEWIRQGTDPNAVVSQLYKEFINSVK